MTLSAWINTIGIVRDDSGIVLCDECPCGVPCTEGDPVLGLLIMVRPVHSCDTGSGTEDDVVIDLEIDLDPAFPIIAEIIEFEFEISLDSEVTWGNTKIVPNKGTELQTFTYVYTTHNGDFEDCHDVDIRVRARTACGWQNYHTDFKSIAECCL